MQRHSYNTTEMKFNFGLNSYSAPIPQYQPANSEKEMPRIFVERHNVARQLESKLKYSLQNKISLLHLIKRLIEIM